MKDNFTFLQEIQVKLLKLTELRKEAKEVNDTVTWNKLEKAKDDIERYTIPNFYVEYVPENNVYCLITQPIRS